MMSYLKLILSGLITISVLLGLISPSSGDIHGIMDEEGYWRFDDSYKKMRKYDWIIHEACEKFGLESSLIMAIIKAESDFDNTAISRKGAQGLMQLMPETAWTMGVDDPLNANENIIGGVRYLSLLLNQFNNDKALALAAYNAGPEIVKAYNGIPPFPETRTFIRKVMQYYKEYSAGD